MTKRVVYWTILAIEAEHVLLLLFERLPWYLVLFGMAAHGCYFQLLKSFPFMQLASPSFVLSCLAVCVSTYGWVRHFAADYHSPMCAAGTLSPRIDGRCAAHTSTTLTRLPRVVRTRACRCVRARCLYSFVLGFMLWNCWLVPFAFFISLSVNEAVLPSAQHLAASQTYTEVRACPSARAQRPRAMPADAGLLALACPDPPVPFDTHTHAPRSHAARARERRRVRGEGKHSQACSACSPSFKPRRKNSCRGSQSAYELCKASPRSTEQQGADMPQGRVHGRADF